MHIYSYSLVDCYQCVIFDIFKYKAWIDKEHTCPWMVFGSWWKHMSIGCEFNLHSLGKTGERLELLQLHKNQGTHIYYIIVKANNSLNSRVAI